MRVCFVSFEYPPNTFGGAGTYAHLMVAKLRRIGVEVFVITKGNTGYSGHGTFRVPTSNVTYWRRLFFAKYAENLLHNLNNRYKFDLVHLNEPHIVLKKPVIPVVCTFHSVQANELKLRFSHSETFQNLIEFRDLILKNPVGSICDVFTARMMDKIICPSHHLAKLIKSSCFVNEHKIHVIPNGIDLETVDKKENCNPNILTRYGLDKDNYVLYMGRLSFLKGVQYLIKAFREVAKECPELRLVIGGNGMFESNLRKLAHGIKNVVFTGLISCPAEKKTLYENCLATVVPSIYDTFPMVILEAMARSKPVIASNTGGIPSLIAHRENGFLVKPADIKGLEIAIKRFYEDPSLARKMGMIGRKLVEEKFTANRMVCETIKVYKSLL
ncbi:MAG: glycosyltransferase family 4 protein [Candidatus Jordarchaeaceae archaeon]